MDEVNVSGWSVVAGVLWAGSVGFVARAVASRDANLGDVGIVLSAAAATVTLHGRMVANRQTERNAFELGRDSLSPEVRRIR